MSLTILCYPKCSTCKKAVKWLDEQKMDYVCRDIVQENPTKEELVVWIEKSGLPVKRFFNTSGMLYREMGLSAKLSDMSDDEKIELLATNGMLVKRPLLVGDDFVIPGFRETEWRKAQERN